VKAELLDDGCCGMAGSFGFEEHKYDLSMKVYEHQLGPRLRSLPSEKIVLADGFSCKSQIEQASGRRPLHLAQFFQIARHGHQSFDPTNDGITSDGSDNAAVIKTGVRVLGGIALGLGAFYMGRRIFR
jgi:Fe-S oxidoreductase